jgi:hypothetical protein
VLGGGAYGTGFTSDWGLQAPGRDAQAMESQALQMSFDNVGAGNLTGGNGSNTGRIVVEFQMEPVL